MKVVLNLVGKKRKKESAFEFRYASNDATKIPRYRKRNLIEEGERSFVPQEYAFNSLKLGSMQLERETDTAGFCQL